MSAQPPQAVVFVVFKRHGWFADQPLSAWLERESAEGERDRLNGEPYDIDDVQDHYVNTLPLGSA